MESEEGGGPRTGIPASASVSSPVQDRMNQLEDELADAIRDAANAELLAAGLDRMVRELKASLPNKMIGFLRDLFRR